MNKELFFLKGTQRYHLELEQLLADFLHVESTVAFGMVCSFISVKR
jgi:7-keto-8-aminopelargonate synthetase-like enzyme